MSTPKNHVRTIGRSLRFLRRHRDTTKGTPGFAALAFIAARTPAQMEAYDRASAASLKNRS